MATVWVVRVYLGEKEIAKWRIHDRTEHEAEGEARAEILRTYPANYDWTMTAEEG